MTAQQPATPTWRPRFPRAWKNTKRWVLIVGLTFISGVATFRGMLEIIQANYAGDLDTIMVLAIAGAVALLMLMILYVLDTLFTRPRMIMMCVLLGVYLLLEMISIGFGFGFYWKIIAARSFVAQNTELATTDILTAMKVTRSRLENITESISDASAHSAAMAKQETETGGTCDANTQPTAGPRQRLRAQDEADMQLAKKQVDSRIASLAIVLNGLEQSVADFRDVFAAGDIAQRNAAVQRVSLNVRQAASQVNDFSVDPDIALLIGQLQERASKAEFVDARSGVSFSCPDRTLTRLLQRTVNALQNLPPLNPRDIIAAEGPEATKLAFLRLTNYMIQVATTFDFSVQRLTDTEADLQRKRQEAVRQGKDEVTAVRPAPANIKTLNESDIIPLLVAIFIDACIAVIAFDKQVRHYERYETQVNEAKRAHDRVFFDFIETIRGSDPNAREDGWSVLSTVIMNLFGNFYVAIPKSRDPVIASLKMFFSGLEDQRVLQNVSYVPFLKHFVRREFRKRDSTYQNYRHFDIYRFPRGAWASLLLNTIYDRIERDRQQAPDDVREARREHHAASTAETDARDHHAPDPGNDPAAANASAEPHGNGTATPNGADDAFGDDAPSPSPLPADGPNGNGGTGRFDTATAPTLPAPESGGTDTPNDAAEPNEPALGARRPAPRLTHNGGTGRDDKL